MIICEVFDPLVQEVVPQQTADWLSPDRPVVRAHLPAIEGCEVLTRLKAFLVHQGVPSTLQHVIRDRRGAVSDLSGLFASGGSESDSASDSSSTSVSASSASAVLRVREAMGHGLPGSRNRIWELAATVVSAADGVVEATLVPDIVDRPGIYQLEWGIKDNTGILVRTNPSLLSVERGLFAFSTPAIYAGKGPPTINEIRLAALDTGAVENFLLGDIEFGDEQILQAIVDPIREWNETPPPILRYNTNNFPHGLAWRKAIVGYLMVQAAHHYRRNRQKVVGGGLEDDDKNKEREYLAEGQRLLAEWKQFVISKKVEANTGRFFGSIGSDYSRL